MQVVPYLLWTFCQKEFSVPYLKKNIRVSSCHFTKEGIRWK